MSEHVKIWMLTARDKSHAMNHTIFVAWWILKPSYTTIKNLLNQTELNTFQLDMLYSKGETSNDHYDYFLNEVAEYGFK